MKMTATSLNFSWISVVAQWKRIAAASSLFFDKVVTACKGPRIELLPLAQSWADRPPLCADGGAPKSFFQPLGFRGTDQKIGIGNPPVSVLDCPRPGHPPDPVPGHHSTPRLSAGSRP